MAVLLVKTDGFEIFLSHFDSFEDALSEMKSDYENTLAEDELGENQDLSYITDDGARASCNGDLYVWKIAEIY